MAAPERKIGWRNSRMNFGIYGEHSVYDYHSPSLMMCTSRRSRLIVQRAKEILWPYGKVMRRACFDMRDDPIIQSRPNEVGFEFAVRTLTAGNGSRSSPPSGYLARRHDRSLPNVGDLSIWGRSPDDRSSVEKSHPIPQRRTFGAKTVFDGLLILVAQGHAANQNLLLRHPELSADDLMIGGPCHLRAAVQPEMPRPRS